MIDICQYPKLLECSTDHYNIIQLDYYYIYHLTIKERIIPFNIFQERK